MGRLILSICLLMASCGVRNHDSRNRAENVSSELNQEERAADSDAGSETDIGAEAEAGDGNDTEPDTEPVDGVAGDEASQDENSCDQDQDGFDSLACGGSDCDDESAAIHPEAEEICSFIDENCDDVVNEGLDCTVYAHTSNQLFLVDPFLGVDTLVGPVPQVLDFDTDLEGNLYGITTSSLFLFDDLNSNWNTIGSFGAMDGSTNGFAINSMSQGFATSGNSLYAVELGTGVAQLVGQFGGSFESSGDCVVDKSDRLFFSSKHEPNTDYLIAVNTTTGEGVAVGPIGFKDVYGLTAAWGILFGFTDSGDVIQIDETTGEGRLVHNFPGRSWWGAASSPSR